jgi:hypothetical protein
MANYNFKCRNQHLNFRMKIDLDLLLAEIVVMMLTEIISKIIIKARLDLKLLFLIKMIN